MKKVVLIVTMIVVLCVLVVLCENEDVLMHGGMDYSENAAEDSYTNGSSQNQSSNELNNYPVKDMNILVFGDSIFGNDGEICAELADLLDANVYNAAMGGTSISVRTGEKDNYRYFDGEMIIEAFTSGNYAEQDAAIDAIPTLHYKKRMETLKSVDYSIVDLVVLAYGSNDYTQGKTVDQITEALGACIDMLQKARPDIRILVVTPIWRCWENEDSDTKIYNTATLQQIAKEIEVYAKNRRVSVLNAYEEMPINRTTAEYYFDAGSLTHLNMNGNRLYAHILNGKIRSMY